MSETDNSLELPITQTTEDMFKKFLDREIMPSLKEALESAFAKRKRDYPSQEDYFSLSDEETIPQVKKEGNAVKKTKHHSKVGGLCAANDHTQSVDSRRATESHDQSLRGVQRGTHSKSDHVGAMNLSVPHGTKRMRSLHGTRDNSLDTDDEHAGYNDIEDEEDEYVFHPQELLENDFLDEDLDKPSNSQPIRDPLGVEMVNPTRNVHPKGSDWWSIDNVTSLLCSGSASPLIRRRRT
ncbi:hypothetical protein NDU88_004205 [Pleurodeles waltl]|uniref:Uncharacterized protein n=1 Tax=Pleurodeles waltl TaxID=8319 RepID=A0AAV7NJ32_PLEWA|nr:hypothetical protein NDU88_004205 [Pleurodeles waltl]